MPEHPSMTLSQSILTGLKADRFRHPLDLEATNALKQIPGLDGLIRSLLAPVGEEYFYLEHISSSILVSDRQLPDLHQLLLDASRILDLEPPQLYIRQHPAPNAYTLAMRGKKPFMVVHTSLLELLTPEEIQAVIAHELGHLKCDHGVYLTLANLLVLGASLLPNWGTMLAGQLQTQMMEWLRCAEFSCDRSALLVAQNPRTVMSVLMKLAGGSPSLSSQLNLDAFIAQARAYDAIDKTQLGKLLKEARTAELSHPVPVLRAREVDRWASTQDYQKLLQIGKIGYTGEVTSKGEWRNW